MANRKGRAAASVAGVVGVNKLCQRCALGCKQLANVTVVQCKLFVRGEDKVAAATK